MWITIHAKFTSIPQNWDFQSIILIFVKLGTFIFWAYYVSENNFCFQLYALCFTGYLLDIIQFNDIVCENSCACVNIQTAWT